MALDWEAPNDGTAEERAAALREALGLRCPRLDGFLARLDDELLAEWLKLAERLRRRRQGEPDFV